MKLGWTESAAEERALRKIRANGDRVMACVCGLLWVASLCFAVLHGEWTVALLLGTSLALGAAILALLMPGHLLTRLAMAAGFMLFSALLIDESHGVIETHFSTFALLAFLLYYRDWRPVGLAAGLIAVHHYAVCQMQMAGLPVYVFPDGHACTMVWVHGAYVVLEASVLVYLADAIRTEALETAAIARFGERLIATGVIDLRTDPDGVRSEALEDMLLAMDGGVRQTGSVAHGLSGIAAEMSHAIQGILSSLRQEDQNRNGAQTVVRQIAETAARVAGQCAQMAVAARQAVTIVENGRDTMDNTAHTMDGLVNAVTQVEAKARVLDAESRRIEDLIQIMADVARQTDLLSLNASIEAARAGEAGRGFLVVAQEVGALSLRTHTSLGEAHELVDRVRAQAARVCAIAGESLAEAQRGVRQTAETRSRLAKAADDLPRLAAGADDAMKQGEVCERLSKEVVASIRFANENGEANASYLVEIERLRHALEGMSAALCRSLEAFRTRDAREESRPPSVPEHTRPAHVTWPLPA